MILSPTGEVVFVSEGIADSVGVAQQEVMGVSIYELTHDDDASTIQDSLKQNGNYTANRTPAMMFLIHVITIKYLCTYYIIHNNKDGLEGLGCTLFTCI